MLSLLKVVPIWVYAVALMAMGWAITSYKLTSAHADKAQALQRVAEFETTIERQKAEAATTLAAETAKVTEAQTQLAAAQAEQSSKDKTNEGTINDLRGQLLTASRLRDPNATAGCRGSSGGPTAQPRPAAGSGSADATETPGLLSTQLTGLLRRLSYEADQVNNAYASCRVDNLGLRAKLQQLRTVSP